MKYKETITYGLKVILSTKHEIKIDPKEVEIVLEAIASGSIIKVRQGIINPSYVVAVVEDEKRKIEFFENTKYDKASRNQGMKRLGDIFNKDLLLKS